MTGFDKYLLNNGWELVEGDGEYHLNNHSNFYLKDGKEIHIGKVMFGNKDIQIAVISPKPKPIPYNPDKYGEFIEMLFTPYTAEEFLSE